MILRVLRCILIVTVLLLSGIGLGTILLRAFAPWPIEGSFAEQSMVAAAVVISKQSAENRESLYISFDDRDPLPEDVKQIQTALPHLEIHAYSLRSSIDDSCRSISVIGTCKKDNFVELKFLSMPFWRTALIVANTAACSNEVVMFNGPNGWFLVSMRWICT